MTTIDIYLNAEAGLEGRNQFLTGWKAGDRMVTANELTFEFAGAADEVLEKAYQIGNLRQADRNGKQYLVHFRSVSVGDVIRVRGTLGMSDAYYACADFGWNRLSDEEMLDLLRNSEIGLGKMVEMKVAAGYLLTDPSRVAAETPTKFAWID